ncbi:MAG: S46 family peptidase [Candidatus Eisenbacteria bacterium]|nr:S46 family peptidase [Candidatus Eisenbacteria bacterium]
MRTSFRPLAAAVLAASLLAAVAPISRADEGMWTLDNLPLKQLKERYGFTPTPEWIEHVQKASVSFGGGSGAFVSPNGLVITNHHVALGQLQKVSTAEHNYVGDGFYARTAADEMKCPDLELRVLESTENVTDRVRAAVDAKASEQAQGEQRRAVRAAIEKESNQKTGLQSRTVELYRGGEYWLYRYKKYTDVRMVMAPEEPTAFFGGDADNFCFPRHDLDFAFFRLYENGQPVHPQFWFRWSLDGPKEGDLAFVSGNPGTTGRQLTLAQYEYLRDDRSPIQIAQQEHRLVALEAYCKRGDEQARRAKDRIRGLTNNLKREHAFLDILRTPSFMEMKRKEEESLKARVAKTPAAATECAGAWDKIAAAERDAARRAKENLYTDFSRGARLMTLAQQIVHYAEEVVKPNGERFQEFRDSNLETERFQMFSPAPNYADVDAAILGAQLKDAVGVLGPAHPTVKLALDGRAPETVAQDLMEKTQVGDVAFRRQLIDGGVKAVEASSDPLIVWVRKLDPQYRVMRKWRENELEGVEAREGGRIARARFALDGKDRAPDATGTLRLSYGKVAGYDELTTRVPWKTTFFGLYDRSADFGNAFPFELTKRVEAARSKLDLSTPLNFVSTDDIIGGNSGSPVLNRNLEYVGLIFDGNAHSYIGNYAYDDAQSRAVSVHSSAIIEALRKIYDMPALADEITGSAKISSR